MTKTRTVWRCAQCGQESAKWLGRCLECQAWNSFEEQRESGPANASPGPSRTAVPVKLADVRVDGGQVRARTGVPGLDEVLGGGLVAGSLTLLGGDPGVGKSTLLLTALDRFAQRGLPVLYVTGEESLAQVKLRADRLGVHGASLHLLADTDLDAVLGAARILKPLAMVLDSVQTVSRNGFSGIPGTPTQVREVAHAAMSFAKESGIATFLVGHVTKERELAGPKVLEHFVDTVLYFEGDGRSGLRVLRAVKNRFGPAGELALFDMVDEGLREVPDASARLLEERIAGAAGTAVVATLEGTRPLLVEIQALVGPPGSPMPARTCVGVDRARVLMIAAVLQKAGIKLYDRDIFVNAAGGMEVHEPAADLAIACALASSFHDHPLPSDVVMFGEIGLVGEVRNASHPAMRLKEASRHGFSRVVAPGSMPVEPPNGLSVWRARTVGEALEALR